jgi:hypothetical protein
MRPCLVVLASLAACTPDDPVFAEADGAQLLDLDPASAFAERARLHGDAGTASLLPDGEPLPPGDYVLPDTELVVVDAADQVRIAWSDRTLQLLLWLERLDLTDVIAQSTRGTSYGAEGPGGVQWPAGFAVELLDAEAERVWVGADVDGLRVESWVSAHDVDQVYVDEGHGAPLPNGPLVIVRGEVLDGPRGEVLAWPLHDEVSMRADDSLQPVDGYLPVSWSSMGVSVNGWVHEDDAEQTRISIVRGGCGGCYGHGSFGYGGRFNVPAYTPLHAHEGGPVVGQTLRPLSVDFVGAAYEGSADSGWAPLQADTPWGRATVYVEEPL